MPGNLRDVRQVFDADASGYLDEISKIIAANREALETARQLQAMRVSVGVDNSDALRQVAELKTSLAGLGDLKVTVAVDTSQVQQATRQYSEATRAIQDFQKVAGDTSQLADAQRSYQALGLSINDVNARMTMMGVTSGTFVRDGLAAAQVQADATRVSVGSLADETARLATVQDDAGTGAAATVAAMAAQREAVEATRASVRGLASDVAAASSAAAGGSYYSSYTGPTYGLDPAVIAERLAAGAAIEARANAMSEVSAAAQDAIASAVTAGAAGTPGSPGGPGGGGLSAALGGFFGAIRPSNVFGGALDTLKAAHLTTMMAMETLSTVLPAMVAAGAAGAVGLQGAGNVYLRGTGMYTAAEALGGTYGTTMGQMLGMGSSFQQAQNIANGGVYGITGGILDLAKSGQGAFGAMGDQAIAMIDRGVADMVLNNRVGAVTNALAGGVGDLRSFGDVAANIGDTLLNVAPSLPGIGPDLLGILKGGTGFASWLTRGLQYGATMPSWLGGFKIPAGLTQALLGGGLAAEAGYRWGGLVLSGGQLPFWLGGGQVKGLSGLAERLGLGTRAGTAEDALAAAAEQAGMAPEEYSAMLSSIGAAAPESLAGTGLAGALEGGLAGLPIGALTAIAALSAYGISQGQFGTPISNMMSPYMSAISSAYGPTGAFKPVSSALYKVNQLLTAPPGLKNEIVAGQAVTTGQPIGELMRTGLSHSQAVAAYSGQISSYGSQIGQTLGDMIAAGPQAVKALQSIGVKGASVSEALGMLGDAMIPESDIGKGGKLNAQGLQMLKQYTQTYSTLMGGGGGAPGLMAAAGANYIMSTSQMKDLSTINSNLDSLTSIMTGGASGVAALTAALGAGSGVTTAGGGLESMAAALKQSPFTAAGASAWAAFTTGTSSAPGIISSSEQNMDQLRTYQTLGALNLAQSQQLGAYELSQYLPSAKGSSMALAMVMQQGMQANIPGMSYYNPKLSLAQNYAIASKAISQHAGTQTQATQLLTQGTIGTANIPAVAQMLLTGGAGTQTLQQTALTNMATQALQVQNAVLGGTSDKTAMTGLVNSLIAEGVKSPSQLQEALRPALAATGLSGSKLTQAIKGGTVIYKSEVETPKVPKVPDQNVKINAQFNAAAASAALQAGLSGKNVKITPEVDVGSIKVPHITGTIKFHNELTPPPVQHGTGTIRYTSQLPAAPTGPTGHGVIVYTAEMAGAPSGAVGGRLMGASGMRVPGYGGGDITPAMLEPGEVVLPKEAASDPVTAALGAKYGVPGFQAGGIVGIPGMLGLGANLSTSLHDSLYDTFTEFYQSLDPVLQQLVSSVQQASEGIRQATVPLAAPAAGTGGAGSAVTAATVAATSAAREAVKSVAATVPAGGYGTGPVKPLPAAAQKVLDAEQEAISKMAAPWNQFTSDLLAASVRAVKDPMKETAAEMTSLVDSVKSEVANAQSAINNLAAPFKSFGDQLVSGYMAQGSPGTMTVSQLTSLLNKAVQEASYGANVAAAAKQGTGYNPWGGGQTLLSTMTTGLPVPTQTASGQNYQYYTDQATIAAGGTVGVQQQMSDYLQAEKSFQGDLAKLSKGGLNKNLLQQLIAAGPLQGDQEAQSILSGPGGVSAVNSLWSQINKTSNALGIQTAGEVYGLPKSMQGTSVASSASLGKVSSSASTAAGGLSSVGSAASSAAGGLSGLGTAAAGAASGLGKLSSDLSAILKSTASTAAKGKESTAAKKTGGEAAVTHAAAVAAAKSGAQEIHVTVNVSGGGGGTAIMPDGTLSNQALNSMVRQVQAGLLKQAKRTGKTGIQLKNYPT